jgi:obg-like ATPase 1
LDNNNNKISKQPAYLNVVDIAGLVKGASEGQGLGNAFLSHIRACDALYHLCRESDFCSFSLTFFSISP